MNPNGAAIDVQFEVTVSGLPPGLMNRSTLRMKIERQWRLEKSHRDGTRQLPVIAGGRTAGLRVSINKFYSLTGASLAVVWREEIEWIRLFTAGPCAQNLYRLFHPARNSLFSTTTSIQSIRTITLKKISIQHSLLYLRLESCLWPSLSCKLPTGRHACKGVFLSPASPPRFQDSTKI